MAHNSKDKFKRRQQRVRAGVAKSNAGVFHPRLTVFRSNTGIYAQVIDDRTGKTLAAAGSRDKDLGLAKGHDMAAAAKVGEAVAKKAIAAGVSEVVFDRSGYVYHGRVKALAEEARKVGLKF